MLALIPIVALCAPADAAPSYTVHIRELTAPERTIQQKFTGSECVLDAVASLQRPAEAARMDLWIARSDKGGKGGKVHVLQIDWTAIAQHGVTTTNYQLLDGDRLFLQARPAK